MSGINKVILIGHLGEDPYFRYIEGNVPVVTFSLVVSEIIQKKGVDTDLTEWYNIVMWRTQAEVAIKILKKGKLIYLEGKCRTRWFNDEVGNKKYVTEVVADSFALLGRASDFSEEAMDK